MKYTLESLFNEWHKFAFMYFTLKYSEASLRARNVFLLPTILMKKFFRQKFSFADLRFASLYFCLKICYRAKYKQINRLKT
ncbi:MAG: hypothetical protein DRR16_10495 [Candidatus Parabeggiatoa sp. nov. 3]|nr:MAG: hypothetical protein DRR00_04025 [Gammaproteobacteria bacterium]RKZ69115.1 MAG: hypothetical protein DRQ99_01960 [Gammaproteobacteria bacterium]RKZ86101.1 MAG: hypothetical protein DRR16_10495 [Gammaproteobacteria bacterium]